MAGELTSAAQEFLAALDAKDVDGLAGRFTDDAQGVDEISRRWIRGRSEVESYLRQLLDAVSDVRTELRDPQERIWGDAGVVTCWIEQDYTLDGESQHISAPTTIVFRRDAGGWKAALFHSIPLPEQT
jgi:uncharacterized protein (TIGR02246 family)